MRDQAGVVLQIVCPWGGRATRWAEGDKDRPRRGPPQKPSSRGSSGIGDEIGREKSGRRSVRIGSPFSWQANVPVAGVGSSDLAMCRNAREGTGWARLLGYLGQAAKALAGLCS
jgi:hypothetical protein